MYGFAGRGGWPARSAAGGPRSWGAWRWWPLADPRRGIARYLGPLESSIAATGEGPTVRPERMARLEAVLFLLREPLGSRKLAQLAGLADGTEARTLVRKLNRLYDAEGCAFRVVEVAGGFQLMTRPKFAPWLRRVQAWPAEVRLSAPAMETLAVVAYRQPVLRAEIEAIRGVQCGEILRQLMERDLVRIVGRSEELGRPLLYGTTRRFLQVFGLRQLEELPQVGARADRARRRLDQVSAKTNENINLFIPSSRRGIDRENRHPDSCHSAGDPRREVRPCRSDETIVVACQGRR